MLKILPLKGYIYTAFALNVVVIITTLIVKGNLPPVVPLFYGRPAGIGQLITTYGLLIVPLSAIAVTIINIIFAIRVKDDFSKKIFSVASFFISVLTAITVVKIIFLVSYW